MPNSASRRSGEGGRGRGIIRPHLRYGSSPIIRCGLIIPLPSSSIPNPTPRMSGGGGGGGGGGGEEEGGRGWGEMEAHIHLTHIYTYTHILSHTSTPFPPVPHTYIHIPSVRLSNCIFLTYLHEIETRDAKK